MRCQPIDCSLLLQVWKHGQSASTCSWCTTYSLFSGRQLAADEWAYEEDYITAYCNASVDLRVASPKTGKLMDREPLDEDLTLRAAIEEAVEARTAELRRWLALER